MPTKCATPGCKREGNMFGLCNSCYRVRSAARGRELKLQEHVVTMLEWAILIETKLAEVNARIEVRAGAWVRRALWRILGWLRIFRNRLVARKDKSDA